MWGARCVASHRVKSPQCADPDPSLGIFALIKGLQAGRRQMREIMG